LKGKYQFESKHSVDAKGQGDVSAYWLGNRLEHPAAIGTANNTAA
jgi:hypothetical protein